MTFDSRSLEHLRQLGRQLPQELPKPINTNNKECKGKDKQHPIETAKDPQVLFQELNKASPDGNIPSHLIAKLKEIEANQLEQSNINHSNQQAQNKNKPSSRRRLNKEPQEENLYASFNRFLLEEE